MAALRELLSADDIALMREGLSGLTDKIMSQIRTEIPDYDRPMDGRYTEIMKRVVSLGLNSFVNRITGQFTDREEVIQTFEWLGRTEAREGRTLECALQACHLACRLGLAWMMELGERSGWSQPLLARLNAAGLAHQAALGRYTVAGFRAEQASTPGQRQLRRELFCSIVTPFPEWRLVSEQARRIGWPIPGQATMIALELSAGSPIPDLGADMLADLDGGRLSVLVPGQPTAEHFSRIVPASGVSRVASGPTVPIAFAYRSHRCARRALTLGQRGVFQDKIIRWAEHCRTVQLLADDFVAEQFMIDELGGLLSLKPSAQQRYMETLETLMDSGRVIKHAAGRLGLHEHGLKDRIQKLQPIIGDFYADPERWFSLELAVRVWRLKGCPIPIIPPATPLEGIDRGAA